MTLGTTNDVWWQVTAAVSVAVAVVMSVAVAVGMTVSVAINNFGVSVKQTCDAVLEVCDCVFSLT